MEGQDTAFIKYKINLPAKWNKPFKSEEITKLKIYVNNTDFLKLET